MDKNKQGEKTLIDVAASVDEYLSQIDWRVNANANQGYSLGGLILNVSGKVIANYWLDHVYAPEIGEAHRAGDLHIHDLDMLAGYCAGWSLRNLLTEGFNGVPGKVEAKPPKHLSSAVGQMVNFLGTLQNEWAGAVSFSSTDSYLAPFVRKDNLTYSEVKQCIQELIYNLNVPSRWGCVPLDTEILTKEGWKLKDEISISDKIYGFQEGNIIEDEILAVNEYDFDGELIALSNRSQEQLLTPNHRVLRLDNKEKFFVDEAGALFENQFPVNVPVAGHVVQDEYAISDEQLSLHASKQELPMDILRNCSERQIKHFVHAYSKASKNIQITTTDEKIKDNFQELAALVGYGTEIELSNKTLYKITFGSGKMTFATKAKVKYQGKVWCPTTHSSYWIARRNGSVFITGNSQTPFTNLTFDWVCPEDLREQIPYIGGEEMPFSYGDLQAEMDMINRAFIELMTEGDAKGRIFTFPLPTYNITSDFPWESPNVDLLFEMTAKYGLPYFCLEENSEILTDNGIKKIKDIAQLDKVIGSDGQYKAVKNIFRTSRESYIQVTVGDNEKIRCSENHRFPTSSGLKSADSLNLKDKLMSHKSYLEFENGLQINDFNKIFFDILDENDNLITLENLGQLPKFCQLVPKTRKIGVVIPFIYKQNRFQTTINNNVTIPQDLNEDICEILGQLIGDGSLQRGKIKLASADEEVVDFYRAVLQKEFNLSTSVEKCGISKRCKTYCTASVILTAYLEHIGVILTNCYSKTVPPIIYTRNDREIAAFLRGLFDTDGSIVNSRGNNSKISFTSVSEKLLSQVLVLLAMLSIVGKLNKKSQTICITGVRNVKMFSDKIGFRIKRKQEKIDVDGDIGKTSCGYKIVKKAEVLDGKFGIHYRYKKDEYFRIKEYDEEKIYLFCDKLIKEKEEREINRLEKINQKVNMVDIEVESDDHLFLMANNVMTHNSNFVNSDMKPNMIRSMCLFPEEILLFKENEQIQKTTISSFFAEYKESQLDSEWWHCKSKVSTLSLNPQSGKLEWVNVNKLLRTTDNKLVNIRSQDGKLMRLSAHHLVAVFNRDGIETKKAEEVNTDDFVLVIKDASSALNQDNVTDEDIELAWFIGLFIADGNYLYDCRYKQKKLKGVQISFNLQEQDLIEKCKHFVKKRLNYEMKFILDKRYENSLYGYINNKKFSEFLSIDKGVRKYEMLPCWLWNASVPVILSFIDGFFAGDGYKAGKEIHINDEKLAKELNLLLQMVGMSTTYRALKHSQVIRIQHTLGRGSKGNKICREKLHNLVPQFLLDKNFVRNENGQTLYQSYGSRTVGLSTIDKWNLSNEKIEWLRNSDFAVVPVVSVDIENLNHAQEFYDIELEKNHYFVHSDGNISHNCCRLQLDLRELLKRGNGLFGSAESTGSLGVVTVNCARLGYLYKGDETTLYQRLDTLLELGKDSLEIKREVIQHHMDNGLFPFTKRYLGTLRNHFSTLGVNGINEMVRNFTDDQEDLTTEWGRNFAIRLLKHIRSRMVEFQEKTGHLYNLEATPAEGTTYRFAKEDKKRYPDIIQAGTPNRPYYTNSSQLPVGFTDDPFEALELQDELQTKYTGGCIEKGNKVVTNKGVFKIEEIVKNFEKLSPIKALSFNIKTRKSEWDLITDTVKIDVAKHDKINVVAKKGFEITTSDWHPFFVMEEVDFVDKCPVCETYLKNDKALAAHLRFSAVCSDEYFNFGNCKIIEKRADELNKGDYILQNGQNILPKKTQLESDLAYLLGFFIGNFSKRHYTENSIRFLSENDLDKVADILNSHFDCDITPVYNERRFMIETTNERVIEFFFQYRFFLKEEALIPSTVKRQLSQENFFSFIAGLIESNGRVDFRKGKIDYETFSERLAEDLVEVCALANVYVSKQRKPTKISNIKMNKYRLQISATQAALIKDQLPLQRNKEFIKDIRFNKIKRRFGVLKVLSTSKVDVQDNDFYDLTTENNHNYLAGKDNFVFVHNTVMHLYMNERISSAKSCKTLVRRVLENYQLPYITVTPTFSICPVHGYLTGEYEFCPFCDQEILAKKNRSIK